MIVVLIIKIGLDIEVILLEEQKGYLTNAQFHTELQLTEYDRRSE